VITFGYVESDGKVYSISSGDFLYGWQYMGGGTEFASDVPGAEIIKPSFVEEFILGFDKVLIKDLVLSVRGIYKRLGMFLEDGSFNGGQTFFVFNPGTHFTGSYDTDPMGFPEATRNYKALEFVLNKKFMGNYMFTASYTYSRLKGNTAGLTFPEVNQNNPNISAGYDMPDFMYNSNSMEFIHSPLDSS